MYQRSGNLHQITRRYTLDDTLLQEHIMYKMRINTKIILRN
jgi:hypothetical protein